MRPTSGPPRPAATSPLTARLTWPGVGKGGGDGRRRQATVPRRGRSGPLHSRSSAAQPAPEALDSRNAAGSPAMEAELASGPPQPRPRPEATHATERCSRELHLRAPGHAAPRRSRSAPLPGVPASRSDGLPGRERRLSVSAWDDAGFPRPASPLPSRSEFGSTATRLSGRGADR